MEWVWGVNEVDWCKVWLMVLLRNRVTFLDTLTYFPLVDFFLKSFLAVCSLP